MTAVVEIPTDGSVRVVQGGAHIGGPQRTTWAMIVAETMGADINQVHVSDPDTQFKALQRLEKHVEMQSKLVGIISADQATPATASIQPQLERIFHALNKSADIDDPGIKGLIAGLKTIAADFGRKGL